MKWTEKTTIQVPTTVEKTVSVECALVVHKKHDGFDSMTSHQYVPATEDDLRRAAKTLGFALIPYSEQTQACEGDPAPFAPGGPLW